MAFDRPLQNWKPDALLTVAPLHETLEIAKELQFWRGQKTELEEHAKGKARGKKSSGLGKRKRKKSSADTPAPAPRRHPQLESYRSQPESDQDADEENDVEDDVELDGNEVANESDHPEDDDAFLHGVGQDDVHPDFGCGSLSDESDDWEK